MNHKFLNTSEDFNWLRSTHLGGQDLKFESFVLYGNEDSPTKVELYFSQDPLYTDEFHTINFL
jgi:hypothetical protein